MGRMKGTVPLNRTYGWMDENKHQSLMSPLSLRKYSNSLLWHHANISHWHCDTIFTDRPFMWKFTQNWYSLVKSSVNIYHQPHPRPLPPPTLYAIYSMPEYIVFHYVCCSPFVLIPQDRDPNTEVLNLIGLPIPMIDNSSFVRYRNMTDLLMMRCQLVYVRNGTFDLLWKLNYIDFMYNEIIEFPDDFGLAADSITRLRFWGAFNLRTLPPLYFRNFSKLTWLNMGLNDWTPFDPSILPASLTFININYAYELPRFPNFTGWTPKLNTINLPGNNITELPAENLRNVNATAINIANNHLNAIPDHTAYPYIESLKLKQNRLTSVPDFLNTTLKTLSLSNNPLICNRSLCWLRMMPWGFGINILTDIATCVYPYTEPRTPLMEVHLATMECYDGRYAVILGPAPI